MKNKVVNNTIMLTFLSLAKIVFPMLTLPYLTRVLSKDGYGAVVYVKSVMQYLQLTVEFGFLLYGTKVVVGLQEEKEKLNQKVSDIFYASLGLGMISCVILGGMVLAISLLREYWLFTILSFLPVFLTIFLFEYYFRGMERMHVVTMIYVIMRGLAMVLTFVFIQGDTTLLFMPVLDTLGTLVAIGYVWFILKKDGFVLKRPKWLDAFEQLKQSSVYFVANMSTTAFGALNTVIVGIYLAKSDVAYWGVCMQIIGAIQFLFTPIIDGVYPEMLRSQNLRLIRKVIMIYLPIIFLGSIVAYMVTPMGLWIVGGEKYLGATTVFRVLIPIWCISFIGMLMGWPVLGALNHPKYATTSTIHASIFQIACLIILILSGHFNLITLAISRVLTEVILFISRSIYVYSIVKNS